MGPAQNPNIKSAWFPVVNVSGGTIPPFSIAMVTGQDSVTGAPQLQQYDGSQPAGPFVVTGPLAIQSGQMGMGTMGPEFIIAYNQADGTPMTGEKWGPATGRWDLNHLQPGMCIVGNPFNGVVNATWIQVSQSSIDAYSTGVSGPSAPFVTTPGDYLKGIPYKKYYWFSAYIFFSQSTGLDLTLQYCIEAFIYNSSGTNLGTAFGPGGVFYVPSVYPVTSGGYLWASWSGILDSSSFAGSSPDTMDIFVCHHNSEGSIGSVTAGRIDVFPIDTTSYSYIASH
jgi:hypothetical protein